MSFYEASYVLCNGSESAPKLERGQILPLLNSRASTAKLMAEESTHDVYGRVNKVLEDCGVAGIKVLLCVACAPFPALPLKGSNKPLRSFIPGGQAVQQDKTEEEQLGTGDALCLGRLSVLVSPLGYSNIGKLNEYIKAYVKTSESIHLKWIGDTMMRNQTVFIPKLSASPMSQLQVFEKAIEIDPQSHVHYNNCALKMDIDSTVTVEGEQWDRKKLLARAIELKPGFSMHYANLAMIGLNAARNYPLSEEELKTPDLSEFVQGKQMSQMDLCIRSLELTPHPNLWNNIAYYCPPAADAEPFLRNFVHRAMTGEFIGVPARDLPNPTVNLAGVNYTKRTLFEKALIEARTVKNVYNHAANYLLRSFEAEAGKAMQSGGAIDYIPDVWEAQKQSNTLNMAGMKANCLQIIEKALNLDNKYYNAFDNAHIALWHQDMANAALAKLQGIKETDEKYPQPATINVNGTHYDSFGCLKEAIRYLPTTSHPNLGGRQWPASPLLHLGVFFFQQELRAARAGGQAAGTPSALINGIEYTWKVCFSKACKVDYDRSIEMLTDFFGKDELRNVLKELKVEDQRI